jgi:hypothetical protein
MRGKNTIAPAFRYLLKVKSIRGNQWKAAERISHRNEPKINGLYDTVIEPDRERDDKWYLNNINGWANSEIVHHGVKYRDCLG